MSILISTSNYFDQSRDILSRNREKIRYYLQEIKNYSPRQAGIYLSAYDYFCANPMEYDGATMTSDLYDIEGLELASMLHDYLYLKLNCAGNYRYRLLSDKLFRKEMTRMHKSTWNRGYRFVALFIVWFFHTPYSLIVKKRRMKTSDKINMDGVLCVLGYSTPKVWYEEFKWEMFWFAIIILSLIFIII